MDTLYQNNDGYEYIRKSFVGEIAKQGINSSRVLDTMFKVPRHSYVSEALRFSAYIDTSLPIGFGQTVSKPSVIARMVESLSLSGYEKVLEIGAGSGYQTSILAELAGSVVAMERIKELRDRAWDVVTSFGYSNVSIVHEEDFNNIDGTFDAIVVAAGADILPEDLMEKLNPNGVLIIPVGTDGPHSIRKYIKRDGVLLHEEEIGQALFVPFIMDRAV